MVDDVAPQRVYIYPGNDNPAPPPGFVLDAAAPPPVVPPAPDAVPPPVAAPWSGQQNMGAYLNAQTPPPGFVLDPAATDPMTGFSTDVATDAPGTSHPRGLPTAILQAPYEAVKSAIDVASKPGEVLASETPVKSEELIKPAADLAMLTMGTGGIAGVPVKGAEAVLGAGPVRRATPVTSPPPPAGYVLDGTAQSLANDLQTLRQSTVADRAEVGNTIRALPEEAKGKPIGEKLYHAAEDPAEYARLTPEEKAISDQHLDPLRQEQFDLALEAKKLGGGDLVDDPNFMHRIAKGHAPQYDAPGSSFDPVTGTSSLPRTTTALQTRAFYVLESPQGVRKVISPNDSGFTVWNNRTGTSVPSGADIKVGEIVPVNGVDWKVVPARTKEIEQHGVFKGPTGPVPAEYHKNAFVNTADAVVRLREVVRNLKFFKELQASPWWLAHATKAGGNRPVPKGWREPRLPAAKGWLVDPKLADVMDDFYRPGIAALGPDGPLNAIRQTNQFLTSSMFWQPTPHIQNVGVHWAVARGWDWIRPGPMRHFVTDMARAMKAVVTQNKDYQRFLREGGGMVYGGVKNADFYGDIGRHMGMDIEKNWSQYQDFFKKVGISKPAEAIAWWYSKMRNVLWASSDMMMMHRYLELERKGMSTARAIKEAEKHIPNYRIPTKIMGSRAASVLAQEPALALFMRYRYGQWKSYMNMAADIAKGTPAEKGEALGNVAALAVMGYVVYEVLDSIYKKTTDDPKAKMLRRGAMTVPHNLNEFFHNKMSFSDFLQRNIVAAPATKEVLEQFFGHDFFTGEDLPDAAVPRAEHAAKTMLSPYGTVEGMEGGPSTVTDKYGNVKKRPEGRTAGRTVLDTLVGGENTSERTEAGKEYGAMKRNRAAASSERNPKGLLDRAYYGAKHAIFGEPPVAVKPTAAEKKAQKAADKTRIEEAVKIRDAKRKELQEKQYGGPQ